MQSTEVVEVVVPAPPMGCSLALSAQGALCTVEKVEPASRAAGAGVREGDVLLTVNGQAPPIEAESERALVDFFRQLRYPLRLAFARRAKNNQFGDAARRAGAAAAQAFVEDAAAAAAPPPTDVATFVGEHLMSALRHLEPFLGSPAAQHAALLRLEALGRLTDRREWAAVAAAPGLDAGDRRALVALGGAAADGDDGDGAAPADADAATRFCAAWLAVLVRATAAAVVDEVLRVRAMDAGGFAQLAADANYLLNVARALNAPRHAALARLAAVAAAAAAGEPSNPLGGPPGSVEAVLAKIEAALVAKGSSAAEEEGWEVVSAAAAGSDASNISH